MNLRNPRLPQSFALAFVFLGACSLAADFDRFEGPGASNGTGGDGAVNGGSSQDGGDSMDGGSGANAGDGGNGQRDGGGAGADGGELSGRLSLSITGTGEGLVQSTTSASGQPSIVCVYNQGAKGGKMQGTCAGTFKPGTQIKLSADPDDGSSFVNWGGDCTGFGLTCDVTAGDAPLEVTASFAANARVLTVTRGGAGTGVVMSTDGRVVCDGTAEQVCTAEYDQGASVVLVATAAADSSFGAWGGVQCQAGAFGTQCVVSMLGDKGVTASFDVDGTYTLSTTVVGEGVVTSTPAGIQCTPESGSCGASFVADAVVTLSAEAAPSSDFVGWSDDGNACNDAVLTCDVTVSELKHVTATFAYKTHEISVQGTGPGNGKIAQLSPDTGTKLSCDVGPACVQSYDDGTQLLLEAQPAAGSVFAGWTGASGCGASPECLLKVTAPLSVQAAFSIANYSFSASSPNGTLLCDGGPCAASYPYGTELEVTVEPALGYEQTGWGGACAGSTVGGTCSITVAANTTVSATNTLRKFTVSVQVLGQGQGQVTGTVSCSSGTCNKQVNYGSALALTGMATGSAIFAGWGGACSGTEPCEQTVTSDLTITATFSLQGSKSLSVTKVGGGTVTSTPVGITCGSTCSASFADNQDVDLNPVADTGYAFDAWTGCDSVVGSTCKIRMDDADGVENVTATFKAQSYPVSLTFTGDGTGVVSIPSLGSSCSANCGGNLPYGTQIVLTANANASSTFGGWSGRCTNSGNVCSFIVNDTDNAVSASFVLKRPEVTLTSAGGTAPTVSRNPTGAACTTPAATCGKYAYNTSVTLRATADAGSVFSSFSFTVPSGTPPSCASQTVSGANHDCVLNVTQDFAARANFTVRQLAIGVTVVGNGTITSTSGTPNLNCGTGTGQTACSSSVSYGDRITLTPAPAAGYSFSGWSPGICASAGAGACTINPVTAAGSVTATFVKNGLTIKLTGQGVGGVTPIVTDSAGKIECYADGSGCEIKVILDGQNTAFLQLNRPAWVTDLGTAHWTGCTPSENYCVVTVVGPKTVTVDLPLAGPIMFVSDGLYYGDFSQNVGTPPTATGIARADVLCGQMASSVGFPGGKGAYGAWLSTGTSDAIDRFADWGSTPVINPLGETIESNGINAMVSSGDKGISLEATVTIDQNGKPNDVAPPIWTGTGADGKRSETGFALPVIGSYCSDWTSRSSSQNLTLGVGNTTQTSAAWTTDGDSRTTKACNTLGHVVCMMLPNSF